MANKPTHNLSLVTKYKDKTGEEKSKFTQIAPAWETDKWLCFFEIPKGMLITGTIMIAPSKDKWPQSLNESTEGDLLF